MEKMNLQRFAEGNDAALEASSAEKDREEERGNDTGTAGEKVPFRRLIEGEYKQEYEDAVSQRIQAAIQQRFRNQQDAKAQLEAYQPMLDAMKARYDLASRMDSSTQTRESSAAAQRRDAALRQHFAGLSEQAKEMAQAFPDFDLMREMRDPRFLRMTAPGSGISVKDAFFAVHGEELQKDSMRYAAQRAGERIAASVQANASRPMENGMGNQRPVHLRVDIEHMDKKTREEYRRRIRNGEEINFRDKI